MSSRMNDLGWNPGQGARRSGPTHSNITYLFPVVHSDEEQHKAWCINPECGQRLNQSNAKRLCLCHRCEDKRQEGTLVLFANSHGIVGIPDRGAIEKYDYINLVISMTPRGTLKTSSLFI